MAETTQKTMEQIGEDIARLVGQPIDTLPQPDHYAWWHPEKKNEDGSKGGYVTFKRGEPFPWFGKVTITAMFRDADELRIYTLPAGPMGEKEWGVRRYFLSKKDGGSFEVENLPPDAFVQCIADEWILVADQVRSAEREKNQIVAFLETLEEGVMANEAADAIAQGHHWMEEPPEPDKPELGPNGAAQNPPSPSDPLPS
jgi:hypothetical protein